MFKILWILYYFHQSLPKDLTVLPESLHGLPFHHITSKFLSFSSYLTYVIPQFPLLCQKFQSQCFIFLCSAYVGTLNTFKL